MVRVRTRDLNPEPNGYKGPGLKDRTPRYQETLGVAFGVLTNGGEGGRDILQTVKVAAA